MINFLKEIYNAYGSFFLLDHKLTNLLLIVCTMLNPELGLMGIVAGASTTIFRKLLRFPRLPYDIDVVNGILVGLMIGASYAIEVRTVILAIASGLLVVVVSALVSDTLGRWLQLPLLGTPYVLVSYMIILAAGVIQLPTAQAVEFIKSGSMAMEPMILSSIGAIYFNPTAIGGVLVLAAIAISSPYLLFIAVLSAYASAFTLNVMGVASGSTTYLIALMNAVLTAIILGGLFAKPSRRSVSIAITMAIATLLVSLAATSMLFYVGLPALASPFLIVTYVALKVFNANRGKYWAGFWLASPQLPERSIELANLARARGIEDDSLALRPPVAGTWQIYQGFFGKHTHQPPWHYSLDLIKTVDGKSFENEGEHLSEYLCFGSPVLSPAYGTVVQIESTLKDNDPGDIDVINAWGNYILIKLDYGGYLKLAHLKKDSLKVDVNSRVIPGQLLAQVGNSGRSPQPHLHLHVQENLDTSSDTMPFHLTSVVVQDDGARNYSLFLQPEENSIFSTPQINTALKKGLNLVVGAKLEFNVIRVAKGVGHSKPRSLKVELDLNGQYFLVADSGARVAFAKTDELIAFYDRSGPEDEFLDSFILAFGITPFVDGSISWTDAPPVRLIRNSMAEQFIMRLLSPFKSNVNSKYQRVWSRSNQQWIQRAVHQYPGLFNSSCTMTEALICESKGFGGFKLEVNNRTKLLATLVGKGAQADNGIPEWFRESVSA